MHRLRASPEPVSQSKAGCSAGQAGGPSVCSTAGRLKAQANCKSRPSAPAALEGMPAKLCRRPAGRQGVACIFVKCGLQSSTTRHSCLHLAKVMQNTQQPPSGLGGGLFSC